MKIRIEQTLHGYQNGHQLLMSSSQLSSDAKKTLLIQSDLSGSNIEEEFKEYISGFPISNYYAFSKTWYADEMRRPGCVWTHTLLISFSDLGKIPDLEQLLSYFKRPKKDQYEYYSNPISLESEQLINSPITFSDFEIVSPIIDALYRYCDKTILYPAYNSTVIEKDIVQVWSNQWPRLRRNFSFCTGALSLKTLNGNEFDLQIVPVRNLNSVEKQSDKAFIVGNHMIAENWLEILYSSKKNRLRKFLWFYGSDLKGNRKNFKPLIKLFSESEKLSSNLNHVIDIISSSFEEGEGILLKNDIFTDKLFNFNEKDILTYLVSSESLTKDKDFTKSRLSNALTTGIIDIGDLMKLYKNAEPNRIEQQIFENLSISDANRIDLIRQDYNFINIFFEYIPRISQLQDTWNLKIDFQYKIIDILEISPRVNWEIIILEILRSKSDVIFYTLRNNNPNKIKYFLSALNLLDISYDARYYKIIRYNRSVLKDFIKSNYKSLNGNFCQMIFKVSDYNELYNYKIDSSLWKFIYKKLEDRNIRVYASCSLLALGFRKETSNPASLIQLCFANVYQYAKDSQIDSSVWSLIPQDIFNKEDDVDIFTTFIKYFNPFTSKSDDIPQWDYCQILIRTLVNRFVKNNWSPQYFLDTLTTFEITNNAIGYALSYYKGQKYLRDILSRVKNKKIDLSDHQNEIFKFLKNEI